MAQPTQLIFSENPGSLPATYTVPAGLGILLSSVFARFDGGGAAGDFVPCLDLLSQDGKIISRVAVTQTLSAGDLARVTWAPFLRRQASTPAPAGSFSSCIGVAGGGSVLTGATKTANFGTGSVGTNDATFFPGTGGSGGMLIQQTDATWFYWFTCFLDAPVKAGVHRFNGIVQSADAPSIPFRAQTRLELAVDSGGTDPHDSAMQLQDAVSCTTTGSDFELSCTYFNDTAFTQVVAGFGFWAVKLGAGFSF